MKPTPPYLLLLLALSACTPPDSGAPQVEIRSPAQGAALSGTVAVQVEAADDSGIAGGRILARGEGSEAEGVEVGASTLSTDGRSYFVSFAAGALPNRTRLELVAEATDATGNTGRSLPVRVETNNAGAPRLKHLIAFTTPPDPNAQSLAAGCGAT